MYRTKTEFLISRFTRLYPTYWLCVSLTLIVVSIDPELSTEINTLEYLVNLTMLQSYVSFQNIDGVYWTLVKELQFYSCILMLMIFGVLTKTKTWISIWLFLTALYLLFEQPFFVGWFISPEYSAFFIAGICFYKINKKEDLAFFNYSVLISLILASYSIFRESLGFVPNVNSNKQWVCVAVIWLFFAVFWFVANRTFVLKSNNKFYVIGALTYPLYLLHNVNGKIALKWLLPIFGPELAICIVTIFMLFLSYIIYAFYELKLVTSLKIFLLRKLV